MTYPKWVSRGYGLGEILCRDEAEEAEVLEPKANATQEPTEPVPERKKPGPKPKVQ